jgi:hypothetical protein
MAGIRVGKPAVRIDTPSHTKGVDQGNHRRKGQTGHNADGTVDARRSTGIRAKRHNPILPIMPNLPPG